MKVGRAFAQAVTALAGAVVAGAVVAGAVEVEAVEVVRTEGLTRIVEVVRTEELTRTVEEARTEEVTTPEQTVPDLELMSHKLPVQMEGLYLEESMSEHYPKFNITAKEEVFNDKGAVLTGAVLMVRTEEVVKTEELTRTVEVVRTEELTRTVEEVRPEEVTRPEQTATAVSGPAKKLPAALREKMLASLRE
ncbi:MAG: hypothetical protein LQ347_002630 [Umbilicaria vellea]|nr:MAG: hypothetical protein LQ347_002630 [Umbilicaria vellea]